jgi:hypothetical protein
VGAVDVCSVTMKISSADYKKLEVDVAETLRARDLPVALICRKRRC